MSIPSHVLAALSVLEARWPTFKMKEKTPDIYSACLAHLPPDALLRACALACCSETFFPGPEVLLRLASIPGDWEKPAGEAWEEMYRHRHAHTRSPKWSSPAVERAARAVNWNDPDWLSEQIPTIRAQFERYYKEQVARKDREELFEIGMDMERNVLKDAKALYGDGYMIAEKQSVAEQESEMRWTDRTQQE